MDPIKARVDLASRAERREEVREPDVRTDAVEGPLVRPIPLFQQSIRLERHGVFDEMVMAWARHSPIGPELALQAQVLCVYDS